MNADIFRSTCKQYMELRHVNTKEKLRAHTTIGSKSTFVKYWRDPELMPLGIWEQIMDALNVPMEDRWKMLK